MYVDLKRRVALTNYYLLIGRVKSMILFGQYFLFLVCLIFLEYLKMNQMLQS